MSRLFFKLALQMFCTDALDLYIYVHGRPQKLICNLEIQFSHRKMAKHEKTRDADYLPGSIFLAKNGFSPRQNGPWMAGAMQ